MKERMLDIAFGSLKLGAIQVLVAVLVCGAYTWFGEYCIALQTVFFTCVAHQLLHGCLNNLLLCTNAVNDGVSQTDLQSPLASLPW